MHGTGIGRSPKTMGRPIKPKIDQDRMRVILKNIEEPTISSVELARAWDVDHTTVLYWKNRLIQFSCPLRKKPPYHDPYYWMIVGLENEFSTILAQHVHRLCTACLRREAAQNKDKTQKRSSCPQV